MSLRNTYKGVWAILYPLFLLGVGFFSLQIVDLPSFSLVGFSSIVVYLSVWPAKTVFVSKYAAIFIFHCFRWIVWKVFGTLVQSSLNEFREFWNSKKIRKQAIELPTGESPNVMYTEPWRYSVGEQSYLHCFVDRIVLFWSTGKLRQEIICIFVRNMLFAWTFPHEQAEFLCNA